MTLFVAAIDNSAACHPVLEVARRVAKLVDAEVVAVHVQEDSESSVRAIAEAVDVPLLVRRGDVVEELEAALRELKADVLVVGMRSLPSGVAPAGHVATLLMQDLSMPVLVVPPDTHDRPLSRVLLALEGNGERDTLLGFSAALDGAGDADLVVLHVFAPQHLPRFGDAPVHETEAWSREFLRRVSESPESHLHLELRVGDPAFEVSAAVRDLNADLVVLAWHRDLSMQHARIVRHVLETTKVPVLLLAVQPSASSSAPPAKEAVMDIRETEDDASRHPIRRPLAHCPACGSADLDPVVEDRTQEVHFLCRDCSRCWHVEMGFVHRMTPIACLGCPEKERCEAAFAADQAQSRA